MQNAILSGSCNTISNNIDKGISLLGGATLDFAGVVDIYMPLNDVSNNPISILSTGSKYILLSDGYNKLIPNNGGLSISGTIKKLCNPTPSAIVANYNNWDGTTLPPTNYSLTTLPNQGGCPSTPLSVAVTDAHPGPFPYSCNSSAMMISGTSPINNCPSCDNIYTPHFSGKGLEEASVEALEKTTQVGGNDYKEAVNMYNEILMYNLPNPDAAEKYVLNHSYNNMLPALGRAFSIGQITEAQNKIALTPEVQKTIDVQDKLIAEANANNAYLDKYYLTLDKAQTYRLAGRRDLAFTVLDDLATWIQPEQTDYFNYWSCTTRMEQDLMDNIISYDDFVANIDNCGTSANLRHGQTPITQNTNTAVINLGQLVKVYPNPVKDNLTIENLTGIQIKIELTNTMGKVMYSNKFSDSSFNLNCASFKKGIYSLAISDMSGFKFSVKKVVVY